MDNDMTDRSQTYGAIMAQIEPFNKKGVAVSEATTFMGDLEWDSLTVMDFVAAVEDDDSTEYLDNETDLLQRAQTKGVEILHLHLGVAHLPSGSVPLIRTAHGHQPYCPSGSRFLRRTGCACNRNYSLIGCLWGHFVDRCGSARPRLPGGNVGGHRLNERATSASALWPRWDALHLSHRA